MSITVNARPANPTPVYRPVVYKFTSTLNPNSTAAEKANVTFIKVAQVGDHIVTRGVCILLFL